MLSLCENGWKRSFHIYFLEGKHKHSSHVFLRSVVGIFATKHPQCLPPACSFLGLSLECTEVVLLRPGPRWGAYDAPRPLSRLWEGMPSAHSPFRTPQRLGRLDFWLLALNKRSRTFFYQLTTVTYIKLV